MKLTQLVGVLLALVAFTSCTKREELQPTPTQLEGTWKGTNETQQVGDCSWKGATSLPVTASWQVTGSAVSGIISQQLGQVGVPTSFTGTITGNQVKLSEVVANNVLCNGLDRSYFSRYEGSIAGKTLSLVSLDTLCPAQGCIFRRTLNLTRQ
jgi:hypothetical protein